MPALRVHLLIQAGSFEPEYWTFTNPSTGLPIDLTVPGYLASGTFSDRDDGTGVDLLVLTDVDFRRTPTGRVYYEPLPETTAAWPFTRGYYQFRMRHQIGRHMRFSEGPFTVSPQL